jgi:hypothetical protein
VKRRVGFVAYGDNLAGLCVDTELPRPGLEQRSDDLAVGMEDAREVRVRVGTRTVWVEKAGLPGLTRCEFTVDLSEAFQDGWIDQVAVASVDVVVTPHRLRGQVHRIVGGEATPNDAAHVPPHERVGVGNSDSPSSSPIRSMRGCCSCSR